MVAFLNGHVLKNTDQPGEMHLFFSSFFLFFFFTLMQELGIILNLSYKFVHID